MTKIIYRDWNERTKKNSGDKTGIQSVKCRDKFSGKYIYDSFSIYEAKKKENISGLFYLCFYCEMDEKK